mgnify:CR=1 FL=1
MIPLLLSLLLLGQEPEIEIGKAFISGYYSWGHQITYKVQVFDDTRQIFETDIDAPYFLNTWDIKPDGIQLGNIRPGAHVRLIRYRDARHNHFEVIDNFDDEAMAIAMYSFLKPPLRREDCIILNGLAHNRYSIRETIFKKLLDSPKWDVLSYCINSKDAEVRQRFWRIWDNYTINKRMK